MITLELTNEEAEALLQCLDLATKAGGLQTARTTTHLAAKLSEAAKESDSTVPEGE